MTLSETNQETVIATLTAVDMDIGPQANIVYSIVSVNSSSLEGMSSNTYDVFQIDSSNGTLTASDLDAEAYTHHTVASNQSF